METTNFEELELACVEAFVQRDYDKASQLLPNLKQPAAVRTAYDIVPYITEFATAKEVTLLHLASLNGWMDMVTTLLSVYSCNSQCTDTRGQTPLHFAAYGGSLLVVNYLIAEQHCDPLQGNCDGSNSLHYACLGGHLELTRCLITKHGCDPNLPDHIGNMPLHAACFSKFSSLNIVKYLITEHHCDTNSRRQYGRTPLHDAYYCGDMNIIRYLITEQGCDPALPDNDSNMPIHIACLGGSLDVVKYLISEQDIDFKGRGKDDQTALHCACYSGHMDLIDYLITEKCFDPNIPDIDGDKAIHIACLNGKLDVVKFLIIQKKCDINSKGEYDYLPIHCACLGDHLKVVKYLINEHHCDPNSRGNYGRTTLHDACSKGYMSLIQYLISEVGCDPTLSDNNGDTPIHFACSGGQLSVVKYLIMEHHCNPNSRNIDGRTPLHYAFSDGHMDIIQFLIEEKGCDLTPDYSGDTSIHFACFGGHLSLVRHFIIERHCDPISRNKNGETPLHVACHNGHVDLIDYFITELGCDSAIPDNSGNLPIHCACFGGHLNAVKHLITVHHCDPNSRDKQDWTPLCHACINSQMDVIHYLITEKGCDPAFMDKTSPLHIASHFGQTLVVQRLLQDKRVNPLSVDQFKRTPLYYAELSDNSYELLNLFLPLLKSRNDYPIHSFTKAILTGNSGAGKSSLAKVIIKQSIMRSYPRFRNFQSRHFLQKKTPPIAVGHFGMSSDEDESEVTKVETLTAGIDSYVVKSECIGNIVLYDLAGQPEYYFSQSVIMETVMQKTPAIFINLVDLSLSEEEITLAIHYWLTFIDNATSKANNSCIVMVGSHTDLLDEKKLQSRTRLVEDLMDRRVKKLNCKFITMDCRKTNDDFFILLSRCQDTISAYSPPVSLYCHMLYSFLQTKLHKVACQLLYLSSTIPESIVPYEISFLSELLEYLGDKGLIIYLKNTQCLEKSWVVVKREVILKDINGVLFAPKYYKGYHPIASSTGIIRMSSLSEIFYQYDPEMLVKLIVSLEFCHPVNLCDVKTNLQPLDGPTTDNLLFFPSLLSTERPQTLTSEVQQLITNQQVGFGWCLGCKDYEYRFLTSRFLHVLLLRLAYTFPLPSENYSKGHDLYGLEQRCTMWTNGISWNNEDGIRTVVEVIQQSRWVVVTMYHNKDITRPVEYSKHRSAVIRLVLDLQKELAPDLDTFECLISPSLLKHWPLEHLPESDLFTVTDVARSILRCKSIILSYKDGTNHIFTKEALFFEPYCLLSPPTVCKLMDSSKNDQPVSPALLNEVRECYQQLQLESQSHLSLREHLDSMSIFVGRNPLVSILHAN